MHFHTVALVLLQATYLASAAATPNLEGRGSAICFSDCSSAQQELQRAGKEVACRANSVYRKNAAGCAACLKMYGGNQADFPDSDPSKVCG